MKKKPTCKTGLKKNVISKEVFDRELVLCKQLDEENGGKCGWGTCDECGAIPLLYKLYKGVLLEEDELKEVKESIFGKKN